MLGRFPEILFAACALSAPLAGARAEAPEPVVPPVVNDPRLEVSLVAREPDIVTPVGVAVDGKGRVYVVESNTHFRPPDYQGHASDRVKVFEDRDGDGTFEPPTVFADGLRFAMNAAFSPDGALHVVQRGSLVRLEDTNGDGRADKRTTVLTMETAQEYPHNGLGSVLFAPDGFMYVGIGENRGTKYVLRGTDGSGVGGEGDGGKIVRCRPDGSRLEPWATGFWNPFSLTVYAGTHLLSIDDDPEVRPPNRLLDVIRGADFGFKYRYGTAADHPFVAWKGELPGTLSMAGAIGEGATGILAATAAALPASYGKSVLVASWSDRRIEAHALRPQGASLRAERTVLVQGGDAFRPVAMATGPDGSIYFTDWVRRRYELHGHGRVWRLRAKQPPSGRPVAPPPAPARKRLEALLADAPAPAAVVGGLTSSDPHLRAAAITALTAPAQKAAALALSRDRRAAVRVGATVALRRGHPADGKARLPDLLADPDEEVRIAALIWAAEDGALAGEEATAIHRAVDRAPSRRLLEVYRAAADLLKVPPRPERARPTRAQQLARLERPARGAALADQREALWALATAATEEELARVEAVALDRAFDGALRADAAAVLAMHARARVIAPLVGDRDRRLRREAVRALRAEVGDEGVRKALEAALAAARRGGDAEWREELRFALQDDSVPAAKRPETPAEWRKVVEARGGDADAGRRVFVSPMTGCFRCHRVGGLGVQLGPPLTFIGNERPDRLLESLLDPSVDTVWQARVITTKDGTESMGMLRRRDPDGSITLANAAGQLITIPAADIASDREAHGSLMPEGLQEGMTPAAFRDLWTFLRAQNR